LGLLDFTHANEVKGRLNVTKARTDGLLLVLLGSLVFVLLGCALEAASPGTMGDFRIQYYPARCLLHHGDPYNEADVLKTYRADGGERPDEQAGSLRLTTEYLYPPTTFPITLPLAILSYSAAHLVWMGASFAGLILAGFLMWELGAGYAPVLSGALIGFVLANCELIVTDGNVAGIAISLAAIAVWCFLKNRRAGIGILCLAISLALKPHDTWLVWVFFLLAGGVYRKRALQTLAVTFVLCFPIILWVTHISPQWVQELHSNMVSIAAGGGTDPSPFAVLSSGPSMIIDLQAAVSFFRNDPRVYNTIVYILIGTLLVIWSVATLRTRARAKTASLALAVIAALTMLPFYHRECDAKLLMLTIPACAMLWSEGRPIGKVGTLLTFAGLFVTADIPWAIDVGWVSRFHRLNPGFSGLLLAASQDLPAPLLLLAIGIFYLWLFLRNAKPPTANEPEGLRAEV
jgi:hypothetical protein